MEKNVYNKIWHILCCFFLLVTVAFSLENTHAASYHWELTADGWKVQTDGTESYITNQWIFMDGKWYYLDITGVMQTGWKNLNDKWYYLWKNGTMATGWVLLEEMNKGSWYYFEQSGTMVTGWKEIGGCWYYFGTTGEMASDTITPDGYWVNGSGVWLSKVERLSVSGNHFSSAGHGTGGGSPSLPDREQPDDLKDKEQENVEPDPVVPNPKPAIPDNKEPIASDSNAELDQYLQSGIFLKENDQTKIDDFMRTAISRNSSTVIFLSNDFYPHSQKLNRMEYKEIQKFSLVHKQIIDEDKIYYVSIYQLDFADIHEDIVQEHQDPGCQLWGYTISKCNECGEITDEVSIPPIAHVDTDRDLICDNCGALMDCGIGSTQRVRTNLAKPYDTLKFTCIDCDYNDGMLFLSDTVIPYRSSIWYDNKTNNYSRSDVRNWLNLNFYNGLSVAKNIKSIRLPDMEDDLPDKVFCLSKNEILAYAPWTMVPWNEKNSRFYWSRTADASEYVYAVHCSGHIASEVMTSTEAGIRPAYTIMKPEPESITSPIWLEGMKQLRRCNGEEHIFVCINPDYQSMGGKRGALFYTDKIMPTIEAAALWMGKIENSFEISEFEPYIDKEGIHPGFIMEQR